MGGRDVMCRSLFLLFLSLYFYSLLFCILVFSSLSSDICCLLKKDDVPIDVFSPPHGVWGRAELGEGYQ